MTVGNQEPNIDTPYLIQFPGIGGPEVGYISVAENNRQIPFVVKRVFWTYGTPESIVRGRHAHFATHQIIIAVTGRIIVTTEMANGELKLFVLEEPNKGVYIPPNVWHTMQYSASAVQLVLASTEYDATDHIRDYTQFRTTWSRE
jgi:dTDP-4-dehydrorhamnose 3,5-epimerase-like enzyme